MPELAKPPPLRDLIRPAPLVPVALSATLGLVADRYLSLPLAVSLLGAVASAVTVAVLLVRRSPLVPLVFCAGCAALAAAHHHVYRNVYAADDLGEVATADPVRVRLRGVIDEEPTVLIAHRDDALISIPRTDSARGTLVATGLLTTDGWATVSGNIRLILPAVPEGVHTGDEVEAVGWLSAIPGPVNPGEWDRAETMRDRRIRAEVIVRKPPDGVTRLAEGWSGSFWGWLAHVRGWGRRSLDRSLSPQHSGAATALLLGESSALSADGWDRYIRTGVVHVLAISGQHLVVLAGFLWVVLRLASVPGRYGAVIVAAVLIGYALLTGFHPPVARSAIVVVVATVGRWLRRPVLPANAFALAWLAVIALDPTDPFGMGCQLAFLQVAVLIWGLSRLLDRPDDPMDRVLDELRSPTVRAVRWGLRWVAQAYLVTAVLWLASAPLLLSRQNLLSPAGLLIGPPVVVLTSIALIFGFLVLFGLPVGWVVNGCLWASDALVDVADRLPLGHLYAGGLPGWWLWVFYLGVFAALFSARVRRRAGWLVLAGLGWLCVGLAGGAVRVPTDELRVTMLAVGHGGCTVLETPDGRTLVYDTGTISGPEVTRRQVAPYLWHRNVRQIDELFVSHADLDHFNGLPALAERFPVGRVTCNPSFGDKTTPGVRAVLLDLRDRGIEVTTAKAGDRLAAGAVTLEVLHPPSRGPDGNENARSLVLLVTHAGHSFLLTGDLEGPGLDRMLAQPPPKIDVLMAPHHGSAASNTPALAKWAHPKVVISSEGKARTKSGERADPYAAVGARRLGTFDHGAITIHSHATGLVVETFRTGERFVVE